MTAPNAKASSMIGCFIGAFYRITVEYSAVYGWSLRPWPTNRADSGPMPNDSCRVFYDDFMLGCRDAKNSTTKASSYFTAREKLHHWKGSSGSEEPTIDSAKGFPPFRPLICDRI